MLGVPPLGLGGGSVNYSNAAVMAIELYVVCQGDRSGLRQGANGDVALGT